MDIIIAIAVWIILGAILEFFCSAFTAAIGSRIDASTWGGSLMSIPLSAGRMATVFYVIRKITDLYIDDPTFIVIAVADILWGLVMMKWTAERWGMGSNVAVYKTGKCIGSIIFAVWFFVKFYF